MTMKDQKDPNNRIRWVMSRFPTCTTLNSIYDGDRKLVLTRGVYEKFNVKRFLDLHLTVWKD